MLLKYAARCALRPDQSLDAPPDASGHVDRFPGAAGAGARVARRNLRPILSGEGLFLSDRAHQPHRQARAAEPAQHRALAFGKLLPVRRPWISSSGGRVLRQRLLRRGLRLPRPRRRKGGAGEALLCAGAGELHGTRGVRRRRPLRGRVRDALRATVRRQRAMRRHQLQGPAGPPLVVADHTYLFYTEKRGHPAPLFKWRSRFWSFLLKLDPDQPSPTIQAQPGPYVRCQFHWENRRLRLAEIKRLQTFPDTYEIVGSRRSGQKQIGNAVHAPPRRASRALASTSRLALAPLLRQQSVKLLLHGAADPEVEPAPERDRTRPASRIRRDPRGAQTHCVDRADAFARCGRALS